MEQLILKEKIIEHYGADHQLAKAVEEMTELIHVIARRMQSGHWDKMAFYEELADVYVMLDQVKLIFCKSLDDMIDLDDFNRILADEILVKLNRTEQRMREE